MLGYWQEAEERDKRGKQRMFEKRELRDWRRGKEKVRERKRREEGGKGQGSKVDRWAIKAGEKRWKNEHL